MGIFILLTIVLALPMAIACIIYARKYLAKKFYRIPDEEGNIVEQPYQAPDYESAFHMDMTGVPGAFASFLPLLLPIVLILINTVASALKASGLFWQILIFLGQPIVAVGIGLLVAIFTLGRPFSRDTILHEMEKGMASAGIIMLVTGGGGALGRIITMRFVQGSGTVAMTTAASITAPILIASGTVSPVLGAIACCVGSLFFGYFNDSYFWVVNRTLGVSEAKEQLKIWSVTSTIAWAVGVVEVLILSIFMH